MILVYKKRSKIKPVRQPKSPEQLERHFKGIANHWRIEILMLVANEKGITVDQITERLKCNFKTTSEHTRRLVQAGLVRKNYKGRNVTHELSPYGQTIYRFIKTFQHS
jgi:DNA-binding MarR family transcriptional regulator